MYSCIYYKCSPFNILSWQTHSIFCLDKPIQYFVLTNQKLGFWWRSCGDCCGATVKGGVPFVWRDGVNWRHPVVTRIVGMTRLWWSVVFENFESTWVDVGRCGLHVIDLKVDLKVDLRRSELIAGCQYNEYIMVHVWWHCMQMSIISIPCCSLFCFCPYIVFTSRASLGASSVKFE